MPIIQQPHLSMVVKDQTLYNLIMSYWYMIMCVLFVEGIQIHSSKSKHSNVITHSTAARKWESTQSLPTLADRVSKLIYPAAATTQLWLRSYRPGYAVV